MLKQRILVVIFLLPIGVATIMYGGFVFFVFMALIFGLAVWEFANLFQAGGYQPTGYLMVLGVVGVGYLRYWAGFEYDHLALTIFILFSMGVHLAAYERGRDQAATDFAITLAGFIYIGWLGSYLVMIRNLPEGEWWLLVVLPATWLADSGGYFVGKKWGVSKMSPRLSPKKSWQGYIGGFVFSIVGMLFLASLYRQLGMDSQGSITNTRIIITAVVMSIFPTLGDLGESMIKRQVGVKDSGALLPGHGGVFDRVDSWLWAAAIGYYLITIFF